MQIQINTDCNPHPCEAVYDEETAKLYEMARAEFAEAFPSILVQTDWDFPKVAVSFGWSLADFQRCRKCGAEIAPDEETGEPEKCENCGRKKGNVYCRHDGTDGTVGCKECGATAGDFIAKAYDFLRDNDGLTVDDPGYFSE